MTAFTLWKVISAMEWKKKTIVIFFLSQFRLFIVILWKKQNCDIKSLYKKNCVI